MYTEISCILLFLSIIPEGAFLLWKTIVKSMSPDLNVFHSYLKKNVNTPLHSVWFRIMLQPYLWICEGTGSETASLRPVETVGGVWPASLYTHHTDQQWRIRPRNTFFFPQPNHTTRSGKQFPLVFGSDLHKIPKPLLLFFFFLFWPPCGIWSSQARNQIWAILAT